MKPKTARSVTASASSAATAADQTANVSARKKATISSRAQSAASTRESTYQIGPHDHVCVRCEHLWDCLIGRMNDKCYVRHAAKTNKSGPFCNLCMHIIMAKRFAAARQLSFAGLLALLGDFTDVE